ncbi:MAG: hypothetical protein K9J85_05170 [Desulfobacteraceae bacterium]|nr:hypothetical protein [Desulfobacteraceae bacterium]
MTRKIKMIRKCIMAVLLVILLAGQAGPLFAQSPQDRDTQEIVTLLKEQNRELSSDLRSIKRELVALRADLEQPGIKEIFAGIGYIFGLFGVGALVASRRREK